MGNFNWQFVSLPRILFGKKKKRKIHLYALQNAICVHNEVKPQQKSAIQSSSAKVQFEGIE